MQLDMYYPDQKLQQQIFGAKFSQHPVSLRTLDYATAEKPRAGTLAQNATPSGCIINLSRSRLLHRLQYF